MEAYISSMGGFLPGDPVPSDEIEEYIGSVGQASSQLKERVIRNSGVKTRYYAIDKDQNSLYSCSEMAANAVRDALERSTIDADDIELLAAATSFHDLIAPGLASMVHGELGNPPCEIRSLHGICSCGMMAMKDAYLHVKSGEGTNAVACAVEFMSRMMKSSRFETVDVDSDGRVAIEMAFLRYMLSDGAGAAVIQDRPAPDGLSLRIEWISLTSFANQTDACMYLGADKNDCKRGWWDFRSSDDAAAAGALALRQELSMLPGLVKVCVDDYERLVREGKLDPEKLRYVAAHYSSEVLRPGVLRELAKRDVPAPPEHIWYSNLPHAGNTSCASIYLILRDLLYDHDLEPGDQILAFVPESGRYAISFMLVTVVDSDGRA
ncbi:MAG: 3-oxoacyl-ACP synthase [Actinomycetota bacterium]|nr:3-oxoacyl-ACP synthase [Actinomycetota bacterium]